MNTNASTNMTRNTNGRRVEREHVKTISAGWVYANGVLSLDGGGGGRATVGPRVVLASAGAENTTKYSTNDDKDPDGNTKLDPVADTFL